MKICNCCKINKEDTEFKPKKLRSGNMSISSQCRECLNNKANAKYASESEEERLIRKNRVREYNANNRQLINALKRKYATVKRIEILNAVKHEQHVNTYMKHIKKPIKKYDGHVKAREIHIHWTVYNRLKKGIRRGLGELMLGSNWFGSLGYTVAQLKDSIESKFIDGMGWHNKELWQIDHVLPIRMFNLSSVDCKDFKECYSIDNLQPLWRNENIRKYHEVDKLLIINSKGTGSIF